MGWSCRVGFSPPPFSCGAATPLPIFLPSHDPIRLIRFALVILFSPHPSLTLSRCQPRTFQSAHRCSTPGPPLPFPASPHDTRSSPTPSMRPEHRPLSAFTTCLARQRVDAAGMPLSLWTAWCADTAFFFRSPRCPSAKQRSCTARRSLPLVRSSATHPRFSR